MTGPLVVDGPFDVREHPAWPDLVRRLGEHRQDIGYLAVIPSGAATQLAPRFEWTPETCADYGSLPLTDDLDDEATFTAYTDAVAAWLVGLVLANAVPGLRRSYRALAYLPKGAEYLFSVSFPIHYADPHPVASSSPVVFDDESKPAASPAASKPAASKPAASEVAFRGGVGPAAIFGDDDDSVPDGVNARSALNGGDADEGEDEDEGEGESEDIDTPIVFHSAEEAAAAGRAKGRAAARRGDEKKKKNRRKGRVSVRAAQAAFAPIRIDEHMLDIELPDMDDFDSDEALDVADAAAAQAFATFALAYKAMRATLMLTTASSATQLQIAGQHSATLAEALEKQTNVTLSLIDVIADEKLTRAEAEASAEKAAGQRATVERLGGQAIKTTGDLLRARAVLDKVDSIDGTVAADLALKGTSLEGQIKLKSSAADEADEADEADADADADEADADLSVEAIEKAVDRVKGPPPKGHDDLIALLTERPWIAEGLRDPRLVALLSDKSSLEKIRMAAPFLSETEPPVSAPTDDADLGEGNPE